MERVVSISGHLKEPHQTTDPLLKLIFGEIEAEGGMISFARFMELALYHPEHGYYASGRARIGKEGDFFTSVSVGRIYGRLLAAVCREAWERLDCPPEFLIVEQGANDGTMAYDLLESVMEPKDLFSQAARYMIIEPFPVNLERQREKLQHFQNTDWVRSPEELPSFTGIHLSNELLDAFPVHSLRWDESGWKEECVRRDGDSLVWTIRPINDNALAAAAVLLPLTLPVGYRLEVNLGTTHWLETLYKRINQGLVLTIDYGQAGEDRYAPHRADGTLIACQSHRRFNDPLRVPGLRDITSQVDFTALAASARNIGYSLLGYNDQHHFLFGAAEPWLRMFGSSGSASSPETTKDCRALHTLLHPGSMGMQFKAIAFGKDFPETPHLSCFRYQRPGIGAL